MKRIFTLLLSLVMVLSLAAPALAAEDVFEAPDMEEAAPEAPVAPEVPEEAPAEEVPVEAPDLPQAAAVETEDTEAEPETGKLTILGDLNGLWYVTVMNDAGRTDYIADYEDIPLRDGDTVYLLMDYHYTAQLDEDWQAEVDYGILSDQTPGGIHAGDAFSGLTFDVTSESGCDVTVTVVENPDAPQAIPVTWTAPEGVQVKTNDFVLLGSYGTFTCDAGYVPVFTGVRALGSTDMENGSVRYDFIPRDDAQSVHADVKKATGELHITGSEDKVLYAMLSDSDAYTADSAYADPYNGLLGGMILTVYVEVGYDVEANVEPYYEDYRTYSGGNVHSYWYEVPATGDVDIEVVKTQAPVDPPTSGTGWVCDEATGDYYYFVDGVQKFNCWVSSQRGLWYYIGNSGKMITGFCYVHNSNGTGWYMFQPDNKDGCIGRMLTGWQWTYTDAGTGWFNTAHGGLNGQCAYTTAWGAYDAAAGIWADGMFH